MILFVVTLVRPKRADGSLKIQAWIFTFLSVWLLATQIPFTDFLANRRGKIDAFLGGQQLPAQVVQATIAAEGESTKYSKIHSGASLTSSAFGTSELICFPQPYFLPFSLGLRCSSLPSL
jgi:hypothetical protein